MISHDVIIAGAGAAGMFAAAVCAEEAPALRVLVLERGAKPLAKVRVSGGGRCNLTHVGDDIRAYVQSYPRGGSALIGPLHRFGPAETMAWFEAHGVPLVALADGCVFPRSDRSESVIRALCETAARGRVEIRTGVGARFVLPRDDGVSAACGEGFELQLTDGGCVRCRRLLIATGGGACVGGLRHTLEPCVPSLFAFTSPDTALTSLAGMVIEDVRVEAVGVKGEGALLITHGGVSGPAILRLSSYGARRLWEHDYQVDLQINWCASLRREQVVEALSAFRSVSSRKQLGTWSPVGLPVRLWRLLVTRAGGDTACEWGACSLKQLRRLADQVSGFRLSVRGKDPHREEFVTCGGIRLDEVNFKTMESRLHPGLYLAGEVLDIDGLTGGFNLQAAWTTGYGAAQQWVHGA